MCIAVVGEKVKVIPKKNLWNFWLSNLYFFPVGDILGGFRHFDILFGEIYALEFFIDIFSLTSPLFQTVKSEEKEMEEKIWEKGEPDDNIQ